MSMCDFNKVANRFSAWVFSRKSAGYFQNTFSCKNASGRMFLYLPPGIENS